MGRYDFVAPARSHAADFLPPAENHHASTDYRCIDVSRNPLTEINIYTIVQLPRHTGPACSGTVARHQPESVARFTGIRSR